MVIQQFNRLIKNKWVWGVFALTISALFLLPEEWLGRGRDYANPDSAGTLGGKDLGIAAFNEVLQDVRGPGRSRADDRSFQEVNRETWQQVAALDTARQMGLEATDEAVRANIRQTEAFCENGAFRNALYARVLQMNGLTPAYHQAAVKRGLTRSALRTALLNCAGWVSPVELEGAVNDMTDQFTLRVATFTDKNAGKVKVDDKALEAYYRENTNDVALPACMVVRYMRVQADAPARLAAFKISDDEMQDYYDSHLADFKTTGTNGVEVTKEFAEVTNVVRRQLQLLASVEAYQTNFLDRVYSFGDVDAKDAKKVARDRFEKIAAAERAQISTTKPFAPDGRGFVRGLMARADALVPDCPEFADVASRLNPDPYECYGVAAGTNCVYLIECVKLDDPRVPSFAEVKEIIRPDALADAQAKAFKAEVEKARARVAAKLAKDKVFDPKAFGDANVSTSIVFSVASRSSQLPDLMYASGAISQLGKGEISDFIKTSNPRRGLVVYVENREPGKDAAQRQVWRSQIGGSLKFAALRSLSPDWMDWNLNRIGYTTTARTEVKALDDAEDQED